MFGIRPTEVLEPRAPATIIEDLSFCGGNCGIYEGAIVQGGGDCKRSYYNILNSYLRCHYGFVERNADGIWLCAQCVVVAAQAYSRGKERLQRAIYCPVIVKSAMPKPQVDFGRFA